MLGVVSIIVAVVNLVCFVIVLTKLFPAEGAVKGILGIICALYTFIWGWQNVSRFNIRNIMMLWSACIVINIVLNFAVTATTQ